MNLAAMRVFREWQTIPFLVIWVSLTVIYGFRLWRLQPTIVTLVAVTLATGGVIGVQVLRGQEDPEYLVEVPLIALMFLVMVWHGRRRLAVIEENVRVLNQQQQFLQDASHELGTPITVALGHAQLIGRTATDPLVAQDARIVEDELLRVRRLANRMLLLASATRADFLHLRPMRADLMVLEALDRWSHAPRLSVGVLQEVTIEGDADRLQAALDALIENAVGHTEAGARIELSVHRDGPNARIAVEDAGSGIRAQDLERIFDRFARVDRHRNRETGGFGLGLAIVKAIAEAHHGSVRVRSTIGQGSVFEIILPASTTLIDSGREEPLAGVADAAPDSKTRR